MSGQDFWAVLVKGGNGDGPSKGEAFVPLLHARYGQQQGGLHLPITRWADTAIDAEKQFMNCPCWRRPSLPCQTLMNQPNPGLVFEILQRVGL